MFGFLNEGIEYVTSQVHPSTFLYLTHIADCSQLWCDCKRNDHKGTYTRNKLGKRLIVLLYVTIPWTPMRLR